MQSLMFVFIGVTQNNLVPDLSIMHERLEEKYKENKIAVQFTREEELLKADLGDASFCISFLKNTEELNGWYQLAIDFELMLATNPVNRQELIDRYNELKKTAPNLYNKVHYATAISIFDEMNTFDGISIRSFQ